MYMDVTPSRRTPRLFQNPNPGELTPISGVTVQWEDRTKSEVFDISLSGLLVSVRGRLGKLRLGQRTDLQLHILGVKEPLILKVYVHSLTAQVVGFAFAPNQMEGRLTIDQGMKDLLILENFKQKDAKTFYPHFQNCQLWLTGPFDTNLFVFDDSQGLEFICEYEQLVLFYKDGKPTLMRSATATEESKGYLAPFLYPQKGAVKMGASWLSRLIRLLEQSAFVGRIPSEVFFQLKALREH